MERAEWSEAKMTKYREEVEKLPINEKHKHSYESTEKGMYSLRQLVILKR